MRAAHRPGLKGQRAMAQPYVPGQQIPFIGHTIARIGRVSRIVAHPCDVDPIVAVEAFFYSAPIMLGSLFKPAYLNDQEEHFQNTYLDRRRRHGRRQFDADKAFPGVGPGAKKFGWWLFHLAEWGQRLGWYMLVLDSGAQLAVNWTSLAYMWSGCTDPTSGNAKSTLDARFYGPGDAGRFVDLWANIYATYPCWGSTAYVGTLADGPTTFIGEVQWQPSEVPGKQATNVVVQFENVLTNEKSDPFPLGPDDPPYQAASFAHRRLGYLANRQQWGCRILSADGYFGLKGQMRLQQAVLDGLEPDP